MRVLIEVLKDLWLFLVGRIHTSQLAYQPPVALVAPAMPLSIPSPTAPISLPVMVSVPALGAGQGYCAAEPVVTIFKDPAVAFDTLVLRVPYGTKLALGEAKGRFIAVHEPVTGWVLKDSVASHAEVLPQFQRGHRYGADDAETMRLRTCIDDAFAGAEAGEPLQPAEYVTYRLRQRGVAIAWPQPWGRVPGTWQRKLKGQRGIHMDITPHTGAVMEYIIDDVGYLAYVERVSPQYDITVSGIGLTYEGQYTEQVLTHDVWRELRPVFISVV